MGKIADSQAVKAKRYVNQFPTEFTCNPRNELFCLLCATVVRCDKRFHVEQHRQTTKHQRKVAPEQPQASNSQSFLLPQSQKDFTKQVATAFLEADIPIHINFNILVLEICLNQLWDITALLNQHVENKLTI